MSDLRGRDVITLTDGRRVVDYPFPLASGGIAVIQLPAQQLSAEDADRLIAFVRSLVQSPASEPDA